MYHGAKSKRAREGVLLAKYHGEVRKGEMRGREGVCLTDKVAAHYDYIAVGGPLS